MVCAILFWTSPTDIAELARVNGLPLFHISIELEELELSILDEELESILDEELELEYDELELLERLVELEELYSKDEDEELELESILDDELELDDPVEELELSTLLLELESILEEELDELLLNSLQSKNRMLGYGIIVPS